MICMHVLFEQEVSTLLRAAAAGFLLERSFGEALQCYESSLYFFVWNGNKAMMIG